MGKIKINPDALKPKRNWKRHKVQDGSNVFRFLPPFGEEANGYPYRKWSVIWSLTDPGNGRVRPYASSITTQGECPVFEYVKAVMEIIETKKGELKSAGASDEVIKDELKDLNELVSNLRPKTIYAYNGVNKAGEVGIVEVKTTAHKGIKATMSKYIKDYNQDPTSVNNDDDDSGLWINVERTGKRWDTEYKADKVQTQQRINGQMVYVDDRSPLPENVSQNWEDMAYDLSSIYQVKTYDELKEILIANMPRILEEYPEAYVAEFAPVNDNEPDMVETTVEEEPAPQTTTTKTATPKVALKLDDDDDDEPEVEAVKGVETAMPEAADEEDGDFFAQADKILEE